MMAQSYLLDTVVVIRFYQRREPEIVRRLLELRSVFLSAITIGELYHGARRSQRILENVECINILRQAFPILACDDTTAEFYGEIKSELQAAGRLIPINDIWIASLARQRGLTLATHDAHFSHVSQVDG